MTSKNLWGEIKDLPKIKPPIAVLNEQAQQLELLTEGLLIGRTSRLDTGDKNSFYFDFFIIAPSLNNGGFNSEVQS